MSDDKHARFLDLCDKRSAIQRQMMRVPLDDTKTWSDLFAKERAIRDEADALLKEFP